ncbi:MAG TPA: BlaI/MecI/CopY family transcriptional regulator [Allosphingosinicella sp.]|nr:BlaI/MecI/CopY family transcriptional regulator [Allosphingosinicella sp.]
MDPAQPPSLSKRERQIMDVIHRRGQATAAEITAELDGAPTNTTVRTLLRILVDKGHVRFERDGKSYVYRAAADREELGASMMTYVVRTFFGGSPAKAMAALLGREREALTDAQLTRLERLIADAREKPE